MTKKEDDRPAPPADAKIDRRDFLKIVGVAGAAAAVPVAAKATDQPAVAGMQMAQATSAPVVATATATGAAPAAAKPTWLFFNANEASFVQAAVDTLIPKDAVGPGALESGVATYIDRQLAGSYGKGDRLYIDGPFPTDATPQQGYQLPFTPSELIRVGIADVEALAMKTKNNIFSQLSAADRTALMTDLDGNKVTLATIPTTTFFNLFLQLTMEGYFADPMYGGNKDKGVWAMIGFPGAEGMFVDKIEAWRNKEYRVPPKSIADLSA